MCDYVKEGFRPISMYTYFHHSSGRISRTHWFLDIRTNLMRHTSFMSVRADSVSSDAIHNNKLHYIGLQLPGVRYPSSSPPSVYFLLFAFILTLIVDLIIISSEGDHGPVCKLGFYISMNGPPSSVYSLIRCSVLYLISSRLKIPKTQSTCSFSSTSTNNRHFLPKIQSRSFFNPHNPRCCSHNTVSTTIVCAHGLDHRRARK